MRNRKFLFHITVMPFNHNNINRSIVKKQIGIANCKTCYLWCLIHRQYSQFATCLHVYAARFHRCLVPDGAAYPGYLLSSFQPTVLKILKYMFQFFNCSIRCHFVITVSAFRHFICLMSYGVSLSSVFSF